MLVKFRQRDITMKMRPISGGSETLLCGYREMRVLNAVTLRTSLKPIITLCPCLKLKCTHPKFQLQWFRRQWIFSSNYYFEVRPTFSILQHYLI